VIVVVHVRYGILIFFALCYGI